MKKRHLCFILFILVFPFVYAVTGEVITGNVPTNVSIFVGPSVPVIIIFSPENKNYYGNFILLNYTINNGISSIFYNIDNGENITLPNDPSHSELINFSLGNHTISIFVENIYGNSSKNVSFSMSSFSFCGDGVCNGEETCSSCSGDCGTCSPSGGSSSGSGGGGGGTGTPNILGNFEVIPKSVELYLGEGDIKNQTIIVKNKGSSNLSISLELANSSEYIHLGILNFILSPGEEKEFFISFDALSAKKGFYYETLNIKSGTSIKSISLIMEVKDKGFVLNETGKDLDITYPKKRSMWLFWIFLFLILFGIIFFFILFWKRRKKKEKRKK